MTLYKEDENREQQMDEKKEKEEKKDICRKKGRGNGKEVEVCCR